MDTRKAAGRESREVHDAEPVNMMGKMQMPLKEELVQKRREVSSY